MPVSISVSSPWLLAQQHAKRSHVSRLASLLLQLLPTLTWKVKKILVAHVATVLKMTICRGEHDAQKDTMKLGPSKMSQFVSGEWWECWRTLTCSRWHCEQLQTCVSWFSFIFLLRIPAVLPECSDPLWCRMWQLTSVPLSYVYSELKLINCLTLTLGFTSAAPLCLCFQLSTREQTDRFKVMNTERFSS